MSKQTLLLVAIAFIGSACVTDQPLLVNGIFSLDPDHKGVCMASTVEQGGGSLDLAGGGDYELQVGLTNDLDSMLDTTTSDNMVLATGIHRNTVILDTVTFSYTSVPTVNFAQESTPLVFVIPPGTKNAIRMGIFNRKAIETLFNELPGTNANGVLDVRDVKVKIVFSGSVASGGRISSVPVTYPVTVFNSGFTCPTPGDSFGFTGPCGAAGGQDGARLCCASDTSCTVAK